MTTQQLETKVKEQIDSLNNELVKIKESHHLTFFSCFSKSYLWQKLSLEFQINVLESNLKALRANKEITWEGCALNHLNKVKEQTFRLRTDLEYEVEQYKAYKEVAKFYFLLLANESSKVKEFRFMF